MNHSPHFVLRTARLELVACTLELALAESQGITRLASALNTAVPGAWPPPLNDEHSRRWVREQLERDPALVGWTLWYFVLIADGTRELIGNGGFKGAPHNAVVEVGYSILPEHQRNGYATEATRALIAWAFSDRGVDRVAAETLPELEPSLGVMRKCGMTYVGKGAPEEGVETVHYEVTRGEFK